MVRIQIDKTPEHWDAILKELESGNPVELMRKRTVVATLWPRRKRRIAVGKGTKSSAAAIRAEEKRWGMAALKIAAKVLEPEDFSDWK